MRTTTAFPRVRLATLAGLLLGLGAFPALAQTEQEQVFKRIEEAWQDSDSRGVADHFAERVYLKIGGVNGQHSRDQARNKFAAYFDRIHVKRFKAEEIEGSSGTFVHEFEDANGDVQVRKVYIRLVHSEGAYRIDQLTQDGD
ncbi:MAG: DUF4783 domain-containing protein [Planctomycetes bacterium]|nr:DUF4783 domain-containing protein [Planctomycetota bacterium]